MAQRSKSKKNQSSGPASLKTEKEAKLTVSQVIRDERTHKITGAVFLLFSIFLFIAFTSFLFTWEEDQSIVRGISVFSASQNDRVANLLGSVGAHVSYFFFFNGFGVASYFICSFFFITGVNWLFAKKIFSIRRNMRYVIIGLLFLSAALAFITRGSSFPWGGAVGNIMSDWMIHFLGRIGTACVLFAGALSYFIWRFNPEFKVPAIPKKDRPAGPLPLNEEEGGPSLFIEEPAPKNKKNKFGKEADIPLIFPDDEQQPDMAPFINEEFKPKMPVPPVIPPRLPKKEPVTNPLELEIRAVPEKEPDEILTEGTPDKLPDYEPTLDLKSYKYPTLDLLGAHGSDRIIQDPAELEANKNQIIGTLKNYDIDIQKISATVGPTVTLYEIVPS
ncbi:MAG TPA: DNA translocase FtsK 4TM domain-containing protein, partial [Puia sp.]